MKPNSGRFTKGFIPWNKGIHPNYVQGEKHPMFGKKHKLESIEKMKISLKGKSSWNKGKKGLQVAWNKGKKRTWESLTQFKKGHSAKDFNWTDRIPWNKGKVGLAIGFPKGTHNVKISGENHYVWKGGVTPENHKIRMTLEYKIACANSKERDDYTCQMPACGIRGGKLHSHHIKPFSKHIELRFELSNLITLCEDCHRKVTRQEEKFEELFISIIKSKNG